MIPYSQFGLLRLRPFRPEAEVVELDDWEYEGRCWVGEAIKFSEWLRPEEKPEALGSLSLDFDEFPAPAADRVLEALDLPVRAGMTFEELKAVLGEPVETLRFSPNKVTYEFLTAGAEPYQVSCTVKNQGGLSYLGVMIPAGRAE
ncbi:hypothetical protein [Planctomyces sp. SH-PL62]|uniref:hypothetical protein n=1 Tax=Planctomyces sp. SH-PL62 TaxID=1636152 RepID=UPI00078E334A|nr:hypothetical protein [Planctomyces sp. SH-PL62]AMV37533.1 hypothetical protein VT85_08860 [Planctomyces sp. SH-PL62]